MNDQQTPELADMTARSIGFVQPHSVSPDEFEQIRTFFDDRASIEPKDLYGYRLIACSDGADAYYTRQDPETSMTNFVDDLKGGSAVLGSHLYETFPFGNSYNGRIVDADASMQQYEPTFYRELDLPEHRASKWVIGDYYIRRGITLNGQPTDDLISAIEAGIARRASITFTIGKHVCNIDGEDMLLGWDRLFADPEELACRHFPGVRYPDEGWCLAWMKGNQLLETSHVYRNASPSSMLIRKAEAMASRGMLSGADLVRLEERLGQRLPRPEHRLHPASRANAGGNDVTKPQDAARETEPTAPGGETKINSTDATGEPSGQPQEPATGGEGGRTTDEEPISVLNEAVSRVADQLKADASAFTTAQLESISAAEALLETSLQAAGFDQTAGGRVAQQYETRNQAIAEALGTDLNVEAIRTLKRDAEMGGELFVELVRDAVAARVAALGENANAEEYRKQLEASRSVPFVKSEITAYTAIKAAKYTPGRTVVTRPVEPREAPKQAADKPSSNILSRS